MFEVNNAIFYLSSLVFYFYFALCDSLFKVGYLSFKVSDRILKGQYSFLNSFYLLLDSFLIFFLLGDIVLCAVYLLVKVSLLLFKLAYFILGRGYFFSCCSLLPDFLQKRSALS